MTVYFLAVLCVSKYRSILESVTQDLTEETPAPPVEGTTGNRGNQTSSDPPSEDNGPPTGGTQEREERVIERSISVETDATATPDLAQTFHFPTVPEREVGVACGSEGAVPASVMFYRQSMDTSEQITEALRFVGPLLCEVLVRERSGLARLLVGSDGRTLLNDGVCVCDV